MAFLDKTGLEHLWAHIVSKINDAKIIVDDTLSSTSMNPVQNKVINATISNLSQLVDNKVGTSDIADNLTTNASGKVLSAAQGVALKAMIDGIVIPTTLPNPQPITINGQRYDGSEAVTLSPGDLGAATAEEVSQLKGDVAAITPDDTVVDGKPWTSKKIVDSLCMPIEATGNPVQVYPVEGYPLGVKVSWEPTQEGSGDPSPENIRPISGRDAVSVTRCGRNLVKHIHDPGYTETKNGLTFVVNDDYSITVRGTATAGSYFNFLAIKSEDLIATYYINAMGMTVVRNGFEIRDIVVQPYPSQYNTRLYLVITKDTVVDTTYYPTIVYGTTAEPYEPYTGSTTDIALPETVYGGALDMNAGVLTVDRVCKTLTGDETFILEGDKPYFLVRNFLIGNTGELKDADGKCSHLPVGYISSSDDNQCIAGYNESLYIRYYALFDSVESIKGYISAQHAAGTPVQVCYKLATPYTIQLTKQQIAVLSGVNTVYTDAGTLTVTGREDPRHTIVTLTDRIAALESAAAGV